MAVFFDARAAGVLAGAPATLIDSAVAAAEQNALVLEELRRGGTGTKADGGNNGQSRDQN
jgi:hypothetical protein